MLVSTSSTIQTSELHFPNTNSSNIKYNNSHLYPLKRLRTCAIIGNSGILLNAGCGQQIDKNDFVIRSNIASVEGFKDDVGSKRNMVTINRVVLKGLVDGFAGGKTRPMFKKNVKHYNGSIMWFQLDLTNETTPMLTDLAKYFKKAKMSVYFAFSTLPIRIHSLR